MPPKAKPKAKAKAKSPTKAKAVARATNKTSVVVNVSTVKRPTRRKAAQAQPLALPSRPLNTRAAPLGTMSPYMMMPTGVEGLQAEVANLRGEIQRATAPVMMPPMPVVERSPNVPVIVETATKEAQTQRLTRDVETQLGKIVSKAPAAPAPAAATRPPPVAAPLVASLNKVVRGRTKERSIPIQTPSMMKPTIPNTPFLQRSRQRPTVLNNIFRESTADSAPSTSRELVMYDRTIGAKRKKDEKAASIKSRLVRGTTMIERPRAVIDPWNMATLNTDRPRDLATYMRQRRGGMGYDDLEGTRVPKKRGGVREEEQEEYIRKVLRRPILLSNQDRQVIAQNLFRN